METASITETKNRLSALLERVKAGTVIVIYDRDQPVARLCPIGADEGDDDSSWNARLHRLERGGLIHRPSTRKRLPKDWFSRSLPRPKNGVSGSAILIGEREEGR